MPIDDATKGEYTSLQSNEEILMDYSIYRVRIIIVYIYIYTWMIACTCVTYRRAHKLISFLIFNRHHGMRSA